MQEFSIANLPVGEMAIHSRVGIVPFACFVLFVPLIDNLVVITKTDQVEEIGNDTNAEPVVKFLDTPLTCLLQENLGSSLQSQLKCGM